MSFAFYVFLCIFVGKNTFIFIILLSMSATPYEVAQAIRKDWVEIRKLKLAQVARELNTSPQNITGLLKGKARFRQKTANLLKAKFGYSLDYLLKGEGELYGDLTPVIQSSVKGNDLAVTTPFGEYYPNDDGLTGRQVYLNKYAKLLAPILQIVMDSFPHEMLDINVNTDDFEAHDEMEANIYRYIAFSESIIRQILLPSLILRKMNDTEL